MITESQNELLLHKLMLFYNLDNNLNKMLKIINGEWKDQNEIDLHHNGI
jgi:hypothetical protein